LAQKLQLLGHGNSTIYPKHYMSQHNPVDVASVFKGRGTRLNDPNDVRGMRVDQDSGAPLKVPNHVLQTAVLEDKLTRIFWILVPI